VTVRTIWLWLLAFELASWLGAAELVALVT